ncbi:acyltransferase family protein [Priestia flexa]|uniref:Acyltransferase family protein n=1 Tax=Priestia flexa TaxID=86664 RepID=A0ABU4J0H3_9BACI|nr:acyltransferase family protein [Priestia flexa]AQX54826.1 hypothetical protein BC359_11275 [Priestia flexa]MBY6086492.1 acyltransferase family protein [Priestia flexa]MDW8514769.1 acyltransferase family protein [Priestia flexa]UIR31842.1 acyltransferase family protein [Priestia flexa]UZW65418.1 acyltransferase family protein [Priestia flexa]
MREHKRWVDVLKGVGISAVVISHSGHELAQHYLFWFHMPLFFMISGYLFFEKQSLNSLNRWVVKKTISLMVPYVSFGLLILGYITWKTNDFAAIPSTLESLLYGGRALGFYYGVFWFVPCLLLTQILFGYLVFFIQSKLIKIVIFMTIYVMAYLYSVSKIHTQFIMPWSMDTVLMAMTYYAIGYFFKERLTTGLNKITQLVCSVFILLVILLDYSRLLNYELDLKVNMYNHFGLDLLLPIAIVLLLIQGSKLIQSSILGAVFEKFGQASLTIMFLHVPIQIILRENISLHPLIIGVVSLLISFCAHMIFNSFLVARRVFLGKIYGTSKEKNRSYYSH